MLNNKIWTYEEISKPHIKLLRYIGLLPLEGKSFKFYGTRLLNIFWNFIVFSYNSMYVTYGIRMIMDKEFEIDYISEQCIVANIVIRYIILYCKRYSLSNLMDMCKSLWMHVKPDDTVIIRTYERKAYYFWNVILINTVMTVTSFLVAAQVKSFNSKPVNGTRLKLLPFRFCIDIQEEPMYTMAWIIQGIVLYGAGMVDVGIEASAYYLILIACGYLSAIKSRLIYLAKRQNKIKQDNNEFLSKEIDRIHYEIVSCIKFHQHVMKYCEEIERFMRSIFFVGIFTTIYNISMLTLNLLVPNEQAMKYAVLMVLNLIQFFMCQWSPQILLNESGDIADAAYFTSLQEIGNQSKTNKLINFLIMRAQKPIQLTAGGFIKLSMETFGTMVKSSVSFFVLLRDSNI